MFHLMRLQPEPFRQIATGRKTIELRLNDEKRRKLSVGDTIVFQCTVGKEPFLRAKVSALHYFDSFAQLYATLPPEKLGYGPEEIPSATAADMEKYYSPEEQARWGVVGIALELLKGQAEAGIIKTGIFISRLLRHQPEAAGLHLDEHGWADVEELIRCVNTRRHLDRDLLEEIVATNNKQRYSFSADGTRIRANQGHSIKVDVELEEKEPPEYLWHGTGVKYVKSIRKSGLLPKTRLHVHLSEQRDTALQVGSRHGEPFLFRVHTGKMRQDGFLFWQSVNGVWLTSAVPPEYLEEVSL